MTAEPMVFDPEVEALLREIAADPNSSLLRVTRPQAVKGLFERTERVSPGMTGLSSAERHLVQVHRNEVAHLLREVCRWRMLNDPGSKENFTPYSGANEARQTSLQELADRTRSLQEGAKKTESDSALQLIEKCIGGTDVVHVSSLASASQRLEPHDAARIYIGLDLAFRGRPHSAIRVYKSLLAECVEPAMRSSAWANTALAYELLGMNEMMVGCTSQSALASDNPTAATEWLFGALLLEDKAASLAASHRIEDLTNGHLKPVQWYVSTLRARRAAGSFTPTRSQKRFVQTLSDSLAPAARGIVDAFE